MLPTNQKTMRRRCLQNRSVQVLFGLILLCVPLHAQHKLQEETREAWARYTRLTEQRIEQELNNPTPFPVSEFEKLKQGGPQIRQVPPTDNSGKPLRIQNGTIHHWRGAIFVPAINLETLFSWLQEYDRYAERFKKEIEQSQLRSRAGDTFNIRLGLTKSKLGKTVHYDTEHRVVYRRNGAGRASSRSESTKIIQLQKYGTPDVERLPEGNDEGFLWRLNSYWRYSEREGGVIVECESVGLSRSLGSFLGFLDVLSFGKISAIAADVARESMQVTLTAVRDGVRASR
jgi:hypothetical protein